MKLKVQRILVAACGAVVLLSPTSWAGIQLFTDIAGSTFPYPTISYYTTGRAGFLNALTGANIRQETFASPVVKDVTAIAYGDFTVTSNKLLNALGNNSGLTKQGTDNSEPFDLVTFTFTTPIRAFGIDVTDFGTTTGQEYRIAFGANDFTIARDVGTNNASFFVGFVSSSPFTSVVLKNTSPDDSNTLFNAQYFMVPAPGEANWNSNSSGNWSPNANWTPSSPNAIDTNANFGSVITAPRTVTIDSPKTVGNLSFNNTNKYTLAGSSALTIVSSVPAEIGVSLGSHEISAPLFLSQNTTVTITNSADTLKVANLQPTLKTITKFGAGGLEINRIRATGLDVDAGTVTLSLSTTPNLNASELQSLTISPSSQMDITNNLLVLHSTDTGSTARNTLLVKIQSGKNGLDANGYVKWNGSGIISTTANAQNKAANRGLEIYGVGIISNHDFVTAGAGAPTYGPGNPFAGSTIVGANDILIRYTYTGDVNLDGTVNTDDYNYMDWTYLGFGPNVGWASGDVNWDGTVNSDDYNLADNGYLFGGGQLTQSLINKRLDMFGPAYVANLESVAALIGSSVPEPATLAGLTVITMAGLWIRKRRF